MWRKQPEAAPPVAPAGPFDGVHPEAPTSRGPRDALRAATAGFGSTNEPRAEAARLTQAIVLKGEVSGREDLYVDGEVEGSIRLPDSLVTVGPNGCVAAEIEVNEIVIEGKVKGNIRARARVELRRTAQVSSDVVTHRIAIHDGARFNGKIDIVRPEDARAPSRSRGVAAGAESAPAVSFEVARQTKDPFQ